MVHLTQQQGEVLERMDRLSEDTEKLSGDVEKLTFKFDTSQTIGERLERLATSLFASAGRRPFAGATISITAFSSVTYYSQYRPISCLARISLS
jgi:hypothetical protein